MPKNASNEKSEADLFIRDSLSVKLEHTWGSNWHWPIIIVLSYTKH